MFEEIVGSSDSIRHVLEQVIKVARTYATVLTSGETGSVSRCRGEAFHDREADPPLIIATGATNSYFSRENSAAAAPGLRTLEQVIEIRTRALGASEAAEKESEPAVQRNWLTLVIIGAGPTGVELAGGLGRGITAAARAQLSPQQLFSH
jgi:NADH dehydrogenase FAD-containing subunit